MRKIDCTSIKTSASARSSNAEKNFQAKLIQIKYMRRAPVIISIKTTQHKKLQDQRIQYLKKDIFFENFLKR